MSNESPLVVVSNLVKLYGPLRAVNDLSFEVKRGEIVGLLGPNGAGKSTTMKVITCYLAADSGLVSVAGVTTEADPVEVRRHIGYLPENAPLYGEMRVKEYLHYASRMRGLSGSKRDDRIDWAVDACGLKAKYMSPINTLSRGYRQRVGLAQAVLHDPDLLILDEPTSGLDPVQLIEIRKLIVEIGKSKTVLFSTHVMQEVEAVCNRAIIINKGKLAADGEPRELRAKLGGQNKLVARLKASPEEAKSAISGLEGVEDVGAQTLPAAGWVECVISMKDSANYDGAEPGERIYQLCKEKNWDVKEIRVDTISLEDAFLKATGHDRLHG